MATKKKSGSGRVRNNPSGTASWYLKYRPGTILELDQEDVKQAIFKFLENGRIPHALLFAGPKGTGKTSAARIIAKILNCEKNPVGTLSGLCNECDSCQSINNGTSMSVIELDGASNRGIEDIRAIREAAKLSVPGRFRVYIIDEAHMLTIEAANALLKTLEEPPSHVVFILATTEMGKLPETVRSRATTVVFRRATQDELLHALSRVVEGEKLDTPRQVLHQIAKISDGSFRDAIKVLEQVAHGGEKSLEVFGLNILPDKLLVSLGEKNIKEAVSEIGRVAESGVSMGVYIVSILERLRGVLMLRLGVGGDFQDIPEISSIDDIKRLILLFSDAARFISFAPLPTIPLEMVVVEWCGAPSAPLGSASNKDKLRVQTASPPPKSGKVSEEVWKKVLDGTKAKNHTIAALLRSARPMGFEDGKMQILVFYQFHKERLEDSQNVVVIEEVVGQTLGGSVRIEFVLGEKPKNEISNTRQVTRNTQQEEEQKDSSSESSADEDIERAAEEIFGRKMEN